MKHCLFMFSVSSASLVINRRKFGRIGADRQQCLLRMDGASTEGYIVNESIGGIRLGGVALLHLFANQTFTIEYDDVSVLGYSRAVSRGEDGLFEIGLSRELESNETSSEATLINSFWELDGTLIVCLPRGFVDQDTISISFPDGKEFDLPIEDVVQMTRQERDEYLQDADNRGKVGQIYGAMYNKSDMFENRRLILNHEFGPDK